MSAPAPAPTSQAAAPDAEDPQVVIASLQRLIHELEVRVEGFNNNNQILHPELTAVDYGKGIPCRVSLIEPLIAFIEEHDRRLRLAQRGQLAAIVHTPEQNRRYKACTVLFDAVPTLQRMLRDPTVALKAILAYLRDLEVSGAARRGDDIAKLKRLICEIVREGDLSGIQPHSKNGRGFNHDILGGLICTAPIDWENPDVREKVRRGEIHVTADSFPRLIWLGGCPGDNLLDGIFLGETMINAAKLCLIAPSALSMPESELAAQAGGSARRGSNASIRVVTQTTPRVIAYFAVLTRITLSDQRIYGRFDGAFDNHKFYNAVIDFFENPRLNEDAKIANQNILNHWDHEIFGRVAGAVGAMDDDFNTRLNAQRLL